MTSTDRRMTVIIPTLAKAERWASLRRAIRSVYDQDGLCNIIAVVNGNRYEPHIVSALQKAPDVRVLQLAEGNLVKALAAGVAQVNTPYFSFLDDDDYLVPGATYTRLGYMDEHPEADVLVTPGQRQRLDGRIKRVPRSVGKDLVASVLDDNWLPSCSGVFRRKTVGPDYFVSMPRYLEWTYLAFRLARERAVHLIIDDPTPHFTIVESASSESRSLDYSLAMPNALSRMEDPSLPLEIQHALSRKIGAALHLASGRCRKQGRLKDAWRLHLASLFKRGGWRYLPFTRHLLVPPSPVSRDATASPSGKRNTS